MNFIGRTANASMAKIPFFSDNAATDPAYINTRDLDNYYARKSRENYERFWKMYEPYADPEFLTEIRNYFDARYWEMYLTTSLIDQGYKVSMPEMRSKRRNLFQRFPYLVRSNLTYERGGWVSGLGA